MTDRVGAGAVAPYPLDRALPDVAARAQVGASLTEGILIKDATDRTIWFNAAACRILARTAADMLSQTRSRDQWLIHDDELRPRPDLPWPFETARQTGQPVEGVLARGANGDGREMWIELSATPTQRHGEPATIVVIRDVTETIDYRRQLESALAEINRTVVQTELPTGDGVDFAARISSWGGPAFVSGDFVGVHDVEPGVRAFYLGDVCGHDVTAAGMSAVARHTVRSAAMMTRDPSQVLDHLHDVLDADGHHTYVTAIVGFAHRSEDGVVVEFAIAGHPRPVVIGPHGAFEFGRSGPIVGMIGRHDHPVNVIRLGREQRMILFTDGLLRTAAGECSSIDVLEGLRHDLPVADTADSVLARATPGIGQACHDDIGTLVIGMSDDTSTPLPGTVVTSPHVRTLPRQQAARTAG